MFRNEWMLIAQQGEPIPLPEILNDFVYYPACGLDGDPIKYLGKQFQSFVYVDYGVGRDSVLHDLEHFSGCDLEACGELKPRDLVPDGWSPPQFAQMRSVPERIARIIREPFAIWALYRRGRITVTTMVQMDLACSTSVVTASPRSRPCIILTRPPRQSFVSFNQGPDSAEAGRTLNPWMES